MQDFNFDEPDNDFQLVLWTIRRLAIWLGVILSMILVFVLLLSGRFKLAIFFAIALFLWLFVVVATT